MYQENVKEKKLKLLRLELQIRGKQQFYGTKQMANQFTMRLYGKIEEQKISVIDLK